MTTSSHVPREVRQKEGAFLILALIENKSLRTIISQLLAQMKILLCASALLWGFGFYF